MILSEISVKMSFVGMPNFTPAPSIHNQVADLLYDTCFMTMGYLPLSPGHIFA